MENTQIIEPNWNWIETKCIQQPKHYPVSTLRYGINIVHSDLPQYSDFDCTMALFIDRMLNKSFWTKLDLAIVSCALWFEHTNRNEIFIHKYNLKWYFCSKMIIFDVVIWAISLSLIMSYRKSCSYFMDYTMSQLVDCYCINFNVSFLFVFSILSIVSIPSSIWFRNYRFFFSFLVHFTCQINNISVHAMVFVTEDEKSSEIMVQSLVKGVKYAFVSTIFGRICFGEKNFLRFF